MNVGRVNLKTKSNKFWLTKTEVVHEKEENLDFTIMYSDTSAQVNAPLCIANQSQQHTSARFL